MFKGYNTLLRMFAASYALCLHVSSFAPMPCCLPLQALLLALSQVKIITLNLIALSCFGSAWWKPLLQAPQQGKEN